MFYYRSIYIIYIQFCKKAHKKYICSSYILSFISFSLHSLSLVFLVLPSCPQPKGPFFVGSLFSPPAPFFSISPQYSLFVLILILCFPIPSFSLIIPLFFPFSFFVSLAFPPFFLPFFFSHLSALFPIFPLLYPFLYLLLSL